jgi:hypothetical protein
LISAANPSIVEEFLIQKSERSAFFVKAAKLSFSIALQYSWCMGDTVATDAAVSEIGK